MVIALSGTSKRGDSQQSVFYSVSLIHSFSSIDH